MANTFHIQPVAGPPRAAPARIPSSQASQSRFADVLQAQFQPAEALRFSSHAEQRLQTRGIALSPHELHQLDDAVSQLAKKGSRESLVVMERAALIVNVPNRTVITAMPSNEWQSNVFTNIDSAVVVSNPGAPNQNR